ncbi:MAG: molybdate ABC transporter substrate-binding protein [Candidatus Limnocylindrales bacterium]
MRRAPWLVASLASVVAACSSGGTTALPTDAPTAGRTTPVSLVVFAAASLGDALEVATATYSEAKPGTTIQISADSSATLRTQIEQGAPADLFLSADTRNPQALVDAGLADGPPVPFAGNTLTIIVPISNPAGIRSPVDLARAGVKVIAAGDEVPITGYTSDLIDRLSASDGYPEGFAAALAANVVSKEDNVSAIVTKVGLGEGDVGIVYLSDVHGRADVTMIPIQDDLNVTATYAGVVVKASTNVAAAHAFLGWLAGPNGQAALSTFGFAPPG